MSNENRLAVVVSRLSPGWHGLNAALCAVGFILAMNEAHILWLGLLLLAGACFSLWAAFTSRRINRR